MGKIKDTLLDNENNPVAADASELPDWDAELSAHGGHAPQLTGSELIDLQISVLKSELTRLQDSVEELHYKHKYYAEPLTAENLTYIESELKRIIRDFT